MKRSIGVTIAAIITLLGSALVAFYAVTSLFSMLFTFRHGEAGGASLHMPAIPLIATMIMVSLVEFGFAGWGFSTGIGLLRRKAWSRISILVFAGLLPGITLAAALGSLIGRWVAARGSPQSFNFSFRLMMGSFCAALLTIAVWWLVLFTRKSVIEQFSGTAPVGIIPGASAVGESPIFAAAMPLARRPLAITIIAWYYLASMPSMIPAILLLRYQKLSIPLFGTLLQSRGALMYYVLSIAVWLVAGIALLKNQVWGFWLAISNELFRLLNIAAMVFLPGSAGRWEKIMASIRIAYSPEMPRTTPTFPPTFLWIGHGAGFLIGVVILWTLLACRKRFFEFAGLRTRPTLEV